MQVEQINRRKRRYRIVVYVTTLLVLTAWIFSLGTSTRAQFKTDYNSMWYVAISCGEYKLERIRFSATENKADRAYYDMLLPILNGGLPNELWRGFCEFDQIRWLPRFDRGKSNFDVPPSYHQAEMSTLSLELALGLPSIMLIAISACIATVRLTVPQGFCKSCRYDLRGADHKRCPECGMFFDAVHK